MEHLALTDAVARHVRPGDTVHVVGGHSRWTALARELARQSWGTAPGLTLVMGSLGSLGVLLVAGGAVRRVVTAYSGDAFPTYSPNPVYQQAYDSGTVEVEHWSFLTLARRLEAAAAGLPAVATMPLGRAAMAANPAYREVATPDGPLGLLAPLEPDVTLLHAIAADEQGNVVVAPPALEGVAGAFAARRGCLVSVERVVPDLSALAGAVRIPAHRVLAVVEAPYGAHPGGVYGGAVGLPGYAEDVPAWVEARSAARGDLEGWARQWCLEPTTHEQYLARVGRERLVALEDRLRPDSWRRDAEQHPVDADAPISAWETAAVLAAREVCQRVQVLGADAVLAGAGVANLAAWVGVAQARAVGSPVRLTAELGLWDYVPTPADPSIFNFRSFPSASLLADAPTVLGVLVAGPGTTTLGCLGAAQVDARGDLNSTRLADGPFLVGAGGGPDVALGADETVVVTLLRPRRAVPRVGHVTSPGDRVSAVVTDLGVLRRDPATGLLRLAAVPAGDGPLAERVQRAVGSCGWDLDVGRDLAELPRPTLAEVLALRTYDPQRVFLAGD